MAGKDILMARQKELKRLHVIRKVLEGIITQVEASEIVSLSARQIRRVASKADKRRRGRDKAQVTRAAIKQETTHRNSKTE